jgi:hypothetical protein
MIKQVAKIDLMASIKSWVHRFRERRNKLSSIVRESARRNERWSLEIDHFLEVPIPTGVHRADIKVPADSQPQSRISRSWNQQKWNPPRSNPQSI